MRPPPTRIGNGGRYFRTNASMGPESTSSDTPAIPKSLRSNSRYSSAPGRENRACRGVEHVHSQACRGGIVGAERVQPPPPPPRRGAERERDVHQRFLESQVGALGWEELRIGLALRREQPALRGPGELA